VFEEWRYKSTACMGHQDNFYPNMLSRAERVTTVPTDAELTAAAGTPKEAEPWMQLATTSKGPPYAQ
jgi:hypothetical protein